MDSEIIYRDLHDNGLILFCKNNLTTNATYVLGVFVDTDGVVKVDTKQYPYLVQLYLELGAQTSGNFNGKLDFNLGDPVSPEAETGILM